MKITLFNISSKSIRKYNGSSHNFINLAISMFTITDQTEGGKVHSKGKY
uniref:Uncharacterized protein n=1 Tax=Arundo donax TaxID=35708 RepID=A0A0A9AM88_ARUDO